MIPTHTSPALRALDARHLVVALLAVAAQLFARQVRARGLHRALAELRNACAFFKMLGTYPLDTH